MPTHINYLVALHETESLIKFPTRAQGGKHTNTLELLEQPAKTHNTFVQQLAPIVASIGNHSQVRVFGSSGCFLLFCLFGGASLELSKLGDFSLPNCRCRPAGGCCQTHLLHNANRMPTPNAAGPGRENSCAVAVDAGCDAAAAADDGNKFDKNARYTHQTTRRSQTSQPSAAKCCCKTPDSHTARLHHPGRPAAPL